MANVVLQGNVEPAAIIRDLQITVFYKSQVTITDLQFFASFDAQTMVSRNLLIKLSGPAGPPFPPGLSDVDPISFNIRPGVVSFEDLDQTLQALITGGGGSTQSFAWIHDPNFETNGTNTISYGNGSLAFQGGLHAITGGSLVAGGDSLLVATLSVGVATLSLQPTTFIPAPTQLVIGSYGFAADHVFVIAGASQEAHDTRYDPTVVNLLSANNVQDAIDELAIHSSFQYVAAEVLTPSPNGVITVFNLANTPQAGKEEIFYNGIAQERGIGKDYTISGSAITFAFAPEAGASITANYFHT